MSVPLTLHRVGRTQWLTFARPDKRNAISAELRQSFRAAMREAEADAGTDVVVLAGAGGAFCAGADVGEIRACADAEAVQRIIAANVAMRDQWAALAKPTIAAVDGAAYGLGFILALRADFVVCTAQARFCLPEARLGLPVTNVRGYLERFGLQRANDLLIACRTLTAAEAESWGIANCVVADAGALAGAVERLAGDIGKAGNRKLKAE